MATRSRLTHELSWWLHLPALDLTSIHIIRKSFSSSLQPHSRLVECRFQGTNYLVPSIPLYVLSDRRFVCLSDVRGWIFSNIRQIPHVGQSRYIGVGESRLPSFNVWQCPWVTYKEGLTLFNQVCYLLFICDLVYIIYFIFIVTR